MATVIPPDQTSCGEHEFKIGCAFQNKRNYIEARKWFLKAAEQEHPGSQYRLGKMFFQDENYKEGEKWIRKSANNRYPAAQYFLGTLCGAGKGCIPQDEQESLKWYMRFLDETEHEKGLFSIMRESAKSAIGMLRWKYPDIDTPKNVLFLPDTKKNK